MKRSVVCRSRVQCARAVYFGRTPSADVTSVIPRGRARDFSCAGPGSAATMFGSFINRFQTFSPVTSPVTSPKMSRRKYKSPAHRRSLKDEYRDVQSEPEDACYSGGPSAGAQVAGGYRAGGLRLLLQQDDSSSCNASSSSSSSSTTKKNRGARTDNNSSSSNNKQLPLSKSKSTARLDISAPVATATAAAPLGSYRHHHGSKSMGRLDGLKQVHIIIVINSFGRVRITILS